MNTNQSTNHSGELMLQGYHLDLAQNLNRRNKNSPKLVSPLHLMAVVLLIDILLLLSISLMAQVPLL